MTTPVPGTDRHRPVAVIVASIDARSTALASLGRFAEEVGGRGEVVLVDASRDGTADLVGWAVPGVRVLRRPVGRLAPELWRVGLDETEAPLVAFSTAAMVPAVGWLDALLVRLGQTGASAVGGPIEPADGLGATDRAVYLHRYAGYLRPLPEHAEPAGDNAIYRRDRLTALGPLPGCGFWEAEIHRALKERGDRLATSDRALVTFAGGSRLRSALDQRHRHARHYGASRAGRMRRAERLARSAAAPLVPVVMTGRIAGALRSRGRTVGPWLSALPRLSLLLAAWASGEARGVWEGPASDAQEA